MSEVRDILGVIVSRVPLLPLGLGSGVLRLLFGSRRAASAFRKALRKGGMDRRRARELARQYQRQVSLVRLVRRVLRATR